jgi:hypothetical protein
MLHDNILASTARGTGMAGSILTGCCVFLAAIRSIRARSDCRTSVQHGSRVNWPAAAWYSSRTCGFTQWRRLAC